MMNEIELDEMLSRPSDCLISDISKIEGDIVILGAGGKMGPSLAVLAANAVRAARSNKRIIAVSRFSEADVAHQLKRHGVETVSLDLMQPGALNALDDARNVIYMAGRKFGTAGQESMTWALNAWLPAIVAERFRQSNITVFSTGNVYPAMPAESKGATENTPPVPFGEYAMSCLGRERLFEYAALTYGTPVFIYRLNYAVALRYGILSDIALKVAASEPISLTSPYFNCIWQGDANEIAIRSLLHCASPARIMNITGPEKASVKKVAKRFGKLLGKKPEFLDDEGDTAFLSNPAAAINLFGDLSVNLEKMIEMQAEWILAGGQNIGKPTYFEEKNGVY